MVCSCSYVFSWWRLCLSLNFVFGLSLSFHNYVDSNFLAFVVFRRTLIQSYLRFNPSLPFHLNVACVALSRMWTSTVENWQTAGASAAKADVAAPLSLFNWLYLSAQHKYDLTLRERMKNRQNSLRFRFWSWRCGDFVSLQLTSSICSMLPQHKYDLTLREKDKQLMILLLKLTSRRLCLSNWLYLFSPRYLLCVGIYDISL